MLSGKCVITQADGYTKIIGIIESELSQNENEKSQVGIKTKVKYRDGEAVFEGVAKIYSQITRVKRGSNDYFFPENFQSPRLFHFLKIKLSK